MLRPFVWNYNSVGTCWPHVAYSLKPVKISGPCKRTQLWWPNTPNNTQQCCDLLRPFAWVLLTWCVVCFNIYIYIYKLEVTFAFEAEPQLFLSYSQFWGKFEPRCSYKTLCNKSSRTDSVPNFKFDEYNRFYDAIIVLPFLFCNVE